MSWLIVGVLLSQTVKVAFLHHGNQGFSDNGSYALLPGDPGYVGNSYHRTLDTHLAYGVPVEIHISGPLLQSYAWNLNDRGLIEKLKNPLISLVAGSYAENILPYADSEMNRASMAYVKTLYATVVKEPGRPNEPTVIWVPERVWKNESQMPYSLIQVLNEVYGKYGYTSGGNYVWIPPAIVLDDNVHGWYPHTFPDGTPCTNPFKVHRMYDSQGNMVFVVFISKTARDNWVWNNVSAPGNSLNSLLWQLYNDPDQEQVVIYGDDWEKAAGVAGWDFGQPGAPANSYDANIAWAASQNWIQPVYISEACKWWGLDKMYDDNDPNNDPPVIDIAYAAYDELHNWTGGSYDNWYNDFKSTQAYECGLARDLNNNGVHGDYEDLWKSAYGALRLLPQSGPFTTLGWVTTMANLYETAWHSWDPGANSFTLAGWGKNQWNHSRYGGLYAWAQTWLDSLKNLGVAWADSGDVDEDGIQEYLLYNPQMALIFEKRGGRALLVVTEDGRTAVGNWMGFFGGEGDYDDGGHTGLFHESQAENSWFQIQAQNFGGDSAKLILNEAYDWQGNPSTDVTKTVILRSFTPYVEQRVQTAWNNWTKSAVTPDLHHQITSGYSLRFVNGITPNGWTYAGYQDTVSGYYAVYLYGSGQGLVYHNLGKITGGAEKIELGGVSGSYRLFFYAGTASPEVAEPGPGDLEGPLFWNTQAPENVLPGDSALVTTEVSDPSGVQWVRIRYGVNNQWIYPDIDMRVDDGGSHDWNGNGQPDPTLYGGWIPGQSYGAQVEFALHAQDSWGNEAWDNNNGQNYAYTVGAIRFHMDGVLDGIAMLLSSHGDMHLWAYYIADSGRLYVATESAGDGAPGFQNDHFIFVSTAPTTLIPAPWAKNGQVARYDLFLADENDNNWAGWYRADGTYLTDTTVVRWAASPWTSGVLEGEVRLEPLLGFRPDTVYLAVGSYETQDGGYLQWQVPPPVQVNGDIEANEYYPYVSTTHVAERGPGWDLAWRLKPYPNPVGSRLILRFQGRLPDTPLDWAFYDVSGRRVLQGHKTRIAYQIDIATPRVPGVYFLHLRVGTQNLWRRVVRLGVR